MPALNDQIVAYLTVNNIAFSTGDWQTAQPEDGENTIVYWDANKLGPQPTQAQLDAAYPVYLDQLKAADNKTKAVQLLQETDWTTIPGVSDPSNDPYLLNANAFGAYRVALRKIAVYPTADPVWPVKPAEQWSA